MRRRRSRPFLVSGLPDSDPSVVVYERGGLEIIELAHDGDAVTLQLAGEMDVLGAPLLPAVAYQARTNGAHRVTLDLSRLKFCDCAGLRSFVQVHNDFAESGVELGLVGLRRTVSKLFAITQLNKAFCLDEAAAFRAFRLRVVEPSGTVRARRM